MPIVTSQFPPSISVANLNGVNGFPIIGFPTSSQGGYSVSGAGDVNGDGIADLIIGALGAFSAGASYVLFGQSGIGSIGRVDVSSLTGSNGFVITGFQANSWGGASVSGAGDVNGDGIADLIIGAPSAYNNAGLSYVLFGQSGLGRSGSVSVSSLTGGNGFVITGFPASSYGGSSVSGAGDVNGDGIADLIIGAFRASSYAGASYVIFGQSGLGSSGSFNISRLTGSNGFAITGFPAISWGGYSVSGAEDINGDGIADLVVGAPGASSVAGASYVILGKSGLGSSGSVNIASLTGSNGFAITGFPESSDGGYSVSGVGDINGDGIADLVMGAPFASSGTGASYVIFGKSGIGNSGSLSVASLTGSNGFAIIFPTGSVGGASVSRAGDINGDGIADLVVGARQASSHAGASYVIFGQSGIGSSGSASVSSLTGSNGFAITGFPANSYGGCSVSGASDVNGDGIADLIIGADGASGSGASYVLFGEPTSFDATPIILNNHLTVSQGQTVILSSSDISATNPYNSRASLTFAVSNIQHGYFALTAAPTTPMTNFTQAQIQSGVVQFVHDGSTNAPSCNVAINNWPSTLRPCMVTFNALSVLDKNGISLQQGQTVTLTPGNLQATHLKVVDPQLTYVINNMQYGYFAFNSSTQAITRFTQGQVENGTIRLILDGDIIPPSYTVAVSDGVSISSLQTSVVNFISSLLLVNNTLVISKLGQAIVLSDNQLGAVNPGNSTSSLSFTVSSVQHGYFSLVSRPSVTITHFTQQQVQQSKVQFSHDGSNSASSYKVAVSDGIQTTTPQSGHVIFNLAPQFQTNRININSGELLILSNNELSATDPDDPADQLVFTVSQVQQGVFTLSKDQHLSLESFTQAQVQAGDIAFLADGGPEAPSYLIGVSDGYSTTFSTPEITFASPNAAALAVDEATVRNAIYGGTAGGVVGLLFFIIQLYLNRRMTKNLLALEKSRETEIEKQQADYYKHAVKPIVERLFTEVDTTIICGYRSEKETLHYQTAVESIVSHLAKLGNSADTRQMSPAQYSLLRNQIIDQIKIQAKKDYKCCSKVYCCRFFSPEISAKELEERASAIATAVSSALSNPTSSLSLQSPTSSSPQRSVSDLELAAVNFRS